MALGIILSAPEDPNSADNWAVIKNGIVNNVLVAKLPYIQEIQNQYDYLIDISISGQSVGNGDLYDPVQNTFSAPEVNLIDQLQGLLNSLTASMVTVNQNLAGMSQQDINTACSGSQSDSAADITPMEGSPIQAIYNWLIAGGN